MDAGRARARAERRSSGDVPQTLRQIPGQLRRIPGADRYALPDAGRWRGAARSSRRARVEEQAASGERRHKEDDRQARYPGGVQPRAGHRRPRLPPRRPRPEAIRTRAKWARPHRALASGTVLGSAGTRRETSALNDWRDYQVRDRVDALGRLQQPATEATVSRCLVPSSGSGSFRGYVWFGRVSLGRASRSFPPPGAGLLALPTRAPSTDRPGRAAPPARRRDETRPRRACRRPGSRSPAPGPGLILLP